MLPKLDLPLYDVTLPSGTKVTFRPFLVKEEKLLLIAKQADDPQSIVKAIQQVLQNCIQNEVSVDKMPLFDIEYLFLQLRARSLGEVVKLRYKCNTEKDGQKCDAISEYEVDLLKIEPIFGEGHNAKIALTPKIGLQMTYPSFTTFKNVAREDLPPEEAYAALISCIVSIFDDRSVYYTKDIPETEMKDFIESLTPAQVKVIDQFFDTLPKIETKVHFQCPRCNAEEDIVVSGLDAFFV